MIKLYNTLTRKKEVFKPLKKGLAGIYSCGPTVYSEQHIGNMRSALLADFLKRVLMYNNFRVKHVMNYTDVGHLTSDRDLGEDKVEKAAKKERSSVGKITKKYIGLFESDMKKLNVTSVNKYARATNYIPEIISQVKRLIKKRYAYKISDGWYFDLSKDEDYGKLAKRTSLELDDAVSRIDENKEKKNKGDFCLWKFSKKGEPSWRAIFNPGRPGWHIEDTAITEKHFGSQYEIHGGARDLLFPHHEAEISQMEAISGKKPLAKYWMHTGFLTVHGEKMSKSLGNFITIQDFLKKYSPRLLRLLVIKTHYRSPIDYSEKILKQTENELERIDEFITRLEEVKSTKPSSNEVMGFIDKMELGISGAMEDDFNTPILIAVLFGSIQEGNKLLDSQKVNRDDAEKILKFFNNLDKFLGFIFWGKEKKKRIKLFKIVKKKAKVQKKIKKKIRKKKIRSVDVMFAL